MEKKVLFIECLNGQSMFSHWKASLVMNHCDCVDNLANNTLP